MKSLCYSLTLRMFCCLLTVVAISLGRSTKVAAQSDARSCEDKAIEEQLACWEKPSANSDFCYERYEIEADSCRGSEDDPECLKPIQSEFSACIKSVLAENAACDEAYRKTWEACQATPEPVQSADPVKPAESVTQLSDLILPALARTACVGIAAVASAGPCQGSACVLKAVAMAVSASICSEAYSFIQAYK
jgi:hypothetical protein